MEPALDLFERDAMDRRTAVGTGVRVFHGEELIGQQPHLVEAKDLPLLDGAAAGETR